jgi:uncharacterized protein
MKKILKAVGFTLLMGVIYFLVSIFVGIGIGVILVVKMLVIDGAPDMSNLEGMVLEGIGSFMVPMLLLINAFSLVFIFLIFLARKDKFFTYIQWKKFNPIDACLIGVLGVFFNVLIVGLVNISAEVLPIQDKMEEYQALIEPLLESPFPLLFLVISVSAPLFEEIIFRGIVLNDFKKAVPVWLAIIIQGILFGAFHMNWIQGVYASVLGIVLGIIYLKYKSIWAPILMHFTYNSTTFIVDYMVKEDTSLVFVSFVGLIGTVLFAFFLYKRYDPNSYVEVKLEEEMVELI